MLEDAFALMAPGGSFVQFTYGMANSPVPRSAPRRPFEADVSSPIWLNLPPARVWIYRRKGAAPESAIEVPTQDVERLGRRGDRAASVRPSSGRSTRESGCCRRRDAALARHED